jgi:2-methylaconitate cis-trans-isomerase PrpF
MEACEQIRLSVAVRLGLAADLADAMAKKLHTPWISLVSAPADWTDYATGQLHAAAECDFAVRMTTQKIVHKAYPGTGTACTGVAAALPGTVLHEVSSKQALSGQFRLGHPCGTLRADVVLEENSDGEFAIRRAAFVRTARRLMDGQVYVAIDRLPAMHNRNA